MLKIYLCIKCYAMSNKGSFYGISKLASEKVLEEYNKRYNLILILDRISLSEKDYENNYIFQVVKGYINRKNSS